MKISDDYKERLSLVIKVLRSVGEPPPTLEQLVLYVKNVPENSNRPALSFEALADAINKAIASHGIQGTIKSQSLHNWESKEIKTSLQGDSEEKLGIYIGLDPKNAITEMGHFLRTGELLNKKPTNELSLRDVLAFIAEADAKEIASILLQRTGELLNKKPASELLLEDVLAFIAEANAKEIASILRGTGDWLERSGKVKS